MVAVAAEKGRRGVYGKIILTVCGEVGRFVFTVCISITNLTTILILASLNGDVTVFFCFTQKTCDHQPNEVSVFSSTPLVQRKGVFGEQRDATDLSSVLHQSGGNETVRRTRSKSFGPTFYAAGCNYSSCLPENPQLVPLW